MSSSPKGCLPHGWVVKASKQYPDRVYYFNIHTGASTWECPVLDPPRLIEENESPSKDTLQKSLPIVSNVPIIDKKTPVQKTPPFTANGSSGVVQDPQSIAGVNEIAIQKIEKPSKSRKKASRKARRKERKAFEKLLRKSSLPPTAVVAPVVMDNSGNSPSTRVAIIKGKKQLVNIPAYPSVLKGTKPASPQKSFKKPALMMSQGVDEKVTSSKDSTHVSTSLGDLGMKDFSTSSLSFNESSSNWGDDIEMLDVSAELTKIDDIAVPVETAKDLCSYYIVLDTNVLISDLKEISIIKDISLGNCGPPHIFIPWIVIQELDTLKEMRCDNVGHAAQDAVIFLNKGLKSKNRRIHGQSPLEAEDCAKAFSQCNDDRILECCLGLAQKMPPEKVVLITYDKNLVNKALICGINTHTWDSLIKAVQPSLKGIFSSISKKKKDIPKYPVGYELKIFKIMWKARQMLRDVLQPFVAKKMEDAYGSAWNAKDNDKMNLLSGILDTISKYWQNIFANNFIEKDRRNFELLKEKVNRAEGFCGDMEDCLNTLTVIEDIFCHIKRRSPQLVVPVNRVEKLRAMCNNLFSRPNNLDVAVSPQGQIKNSPELENEAESKNVLLAFENTWTVINHLCGMVMDFYHIPHNFFYEKPDCVPTDGEFRNLMVNLYPSVLHIKKLMLGVVAAVKNHNPRKGIFQELCTALIDLVPTLQIPVCDLTVDNFTPEALERFCRNPANIERVRLGCKQIEHFFAKLDEAQKIMSSKKEPGLMILG